MNSHDLTEASDHGRVLREIHSDGFEVVQGVNHIGQGKPASTKCHHFTLMYLDDKVDRALAELRSIGIDV